MLGLRRYWYVIALASEVWATVLVLLAYKDVIDAQRAPKDWAHLLAGLGGDIVLSPGKALLFWLKEPPLWGICLAAAGIYSAVFFLIGFLIAAAVSLFLRSEWFRRARSERMREIERSDLERYLR